LKGEKQILHPAKRRGVQNDTLARRFSQLAGTLLVGAQHAAPLQEKKNVSKKNVGKRMSTEAKMAVENVP
jgi:hypothetical protein